MKKTMLILTLALAMTASLSFAGCGGSESTSDAADDSAVSEVADESADTEESSDEEGSETSASSLSGTYTVSSVTLDDGTEYTYGEYLVSQGLEEGSDEYNLSLGTCYTFAEDGTVTCTVAGVDTAGTYTYDGDSTVTTVFNETETAMTYDSESDILTATDASTGVTTTFAAAG